MWGRIYTYFGIGELEKVLLSGGVPVHLPPHNSTQTDNLRILYQFLVKIDLINASIASDLHKKLLGGTYCTSCI